MSVFEICDSCDKAARRTIVAYWGQRLCPWCARVVADMHDRNRSWPPVPWAVHPDDRSFA